MQAEVEKILPKLGFSVDQGDKLVGNFSGGWDEDSTRENYIAKPDLVLLDEQLII